MYSAVTCKTCGCKGTCPYDSDETGDFADLERATWNVDDLEDADLAKAKVCPHEDVEFGPVEYDDSGLQDFLT